MTFVHVGLIMFYIMNTFQLRLRRSIYFMGFCFLAQKIEGSKKNSMPEFRALLKCISPLAVRLSAAISEGTPSSSNTSVSPGASNNNSRLDSIIAEIRTLMTDVNESYFLPDVELPDARAARQRLYAPIYHHGLIVTDDLETSIFGFRDVGARIPLHNHPKMFGFVKVLRGRIRVSSFSLLKNEELQNTSVSEPGMRNLWRRVAAKFEGSTDLSSTDPTVAILGPRHNNLHMVGALEGGSAFFDLLVPGYKNRECRYYSLEQTTVQNTSTLLSEGGVGGNEARFVDNFATLNVGEIYWLRETGEPSDFRMQRLNE